MHTPHIPSCAVQCNSQFSYALFILARPQIVRRAESVFLALVPSIRSLGSLRIHFGDRIFHVTGAWPFSSINRQNALDQTTAACRERRGKFIVATLENAQVQLLDGLCSKRHTIMGQLVRDDSECPYVNRRAVIPCLAPRDGFFFDKFWRHVPVRAR
jgi:hypothetical protein